MAAFNSLDELGMDEQWKQYVVHCKKSPYDVYIGRASAGMPKGSNPQWGNPFQMRKQSEREHNRVCREFSEWILTQPQLIQKARAELRGKILACWCSPKRCHGHVLSEIANCSDECFEVKFGPILHVDTVQNVQVEPNASKNAESIQSIRQKLYELDSDATLTAQQRKNRRRHLNKKLERLISREKSGGGQSNNEANCLTQDSDATSQEVTKTVHQDTKVFPSINDTSEISGLGSGFGPKEACGVVDIGINITSKQLRGKWRDIFLRAEEAKVVAVLLTGTSIRCVEGSIRIARQWAQEKGTKNVRHPKLAAYCTAGIHPHDAKSFTESTTQRLRELAADPLVVAIGECGLDFNRNFSSSEEQIRAFEAQVELACELGMPMFVHEREAHEALLEVLDRFSGRLPPLVVHCFTGSHEEAIAYIERGFFIGFTGTLCKHERGAVLREILRSGTVPLERIMIETDAPWMGFVKGRRESEPMDVNGVADKLAECLEVDVETVRSTTTATAFNFFRLS